MKINCGLIPIHTQATLSLCYSLMWRVALEYTTSLPMFMSWSDPTGEHSSPAFHTNQRMLNYMILLYSGKGRHKRESKNKNQETKRFSTFAVSRLRHSETKKKLLDSRIKFSAKRVKQPINNLKSHGCVHGLQNEMSLINFSTMFC